jgi:hypothetical protein
VALVAHVVAAVIHLVAGVALVIAVALVVHLVALVVHWRFLLVPPDSNATILTQVVRWRHAPFSPGLLASSARLHRGSLPAHSRRRL